MTTAPTIDHIGIVVAALEPAIESWSRVLPGAELTRRSLPEVGLEVAEFHAANITIELLHYTHAEGGFAREVMGSATGVNHVSIAVADLGAALAGLAQQELHPMPGFPRRGAHGEIAFLRRDPRLEVLVELCRPDAAGDGEGAAHG